MCAHQWACGDGSQLPLQGSLRGFDSFLVHDLSPASLDASPSFWNRSPGPSGKNWRAGQAPIAERIQHRSTEPKISVRFWVGVRYDKGLIVYWLASEIFTLRDRVRFPVRLRRDELGNWQQGFTRIGTWDWIGDTMPPRYNLIHALVV